MKGDPYTKTYPVNTTIPKIAAFANKSLTPPFLPDVYRISESLSAISSFCLIFI